jgi:hypothetical protein
MFNLPKGIDDDDNDDILGEVNESINRKMNGILKSGTMNKKLRRSG